MTDAPQCMCWTITDERTDDAINVWVSNSHESLTLFDTLIADTENFSAYGTYYAQMPTVIGSRGEPEEQ